ncbi:MAG TPA: LamG domain-containing protein [Chitinophagaceae bacterium]|nr:LamG domain-containing protein [Chitinophagaceae bacterium]
MKNKHLLFALSLLTIAFFGCQKMDKPAFGDYLKDSNPPGGPLNFYLAFDGTSSDPLRNAVDSIRANFPSDNPLTSSAGISGKAMKGESKKFIKYAKPNDWAIFAKSFTISFWEKHDGQTKNNIGTNGPEFPFSFKSSNGHWSGGSMFILLEGNNTACAVKALAVDKNVADNWMTWEGGNSVAGLLDNAWHHLVFVYDAATSKLTFYKDGVANSVIPGWGSHGAINIDNSKISEVRIGGGPGTSYNTDDWLSSTWKGDLDQFRMYSTALTAAQVSALYASKL